MFDPVQLRSFVAVAETLSFTAAGRRLGLRQSTVSQHVHKLEEAAGGRRLLERDTRSVALTADGEAMLGFARTILEAVDRAEGHFSRSALHGRVRFGVGEDVVLTELPAVLRSFRRSHPQVDLELTVATSASLRAEARAGRLDLVLGKRPPRSPAEEGGQPVWRDRLVWIGGPGARVDPEQPVPLIVYPPPSITRARATEVLEEHGLRWRVACTSGSLSGLRAAALAGLGVMAHTRGLVPPGLTELPGGGQGMGLPDLGDVEFTLLRARRPAENDPAEALASAVVTGLGPPGRGSVPR